MGRGKVSWFNRFFKKGGESFNVSFESFKEEIPLGTLMRWYLYDTGLSEHPNELALLLGMNPVSDEGHEHETGESEARLDDVEYLIPFISTIAELGADVVVAMQIDEIKKRDPDGFLEKEIERETEMMHMMYQMIGFSALLGGLSTAMKLGLIVPGEVYSTDLAYRKDEDDEQ
jgi:hypothetical protein